MATARHCRWWARRFNEAGVRDAGDGPRRYDPHGAHDRFNEAGVRDAGDDFEAYKALLVEIASTRPACETPEMLGTATKGARDRTGFNEAGVRDAGDAR